MDLSRAGVKRFPDLNELEEIRIDAYLNSKIAKERKKKNACSNDNWQEFQQGGPSPPV